MSLLANEKVSAKIDLVATMDVDTFLKSEYWVIQELEKILKNYDLNLDRDSNLIWMPEESTYSLFYKGNYLTVYLVDPLYYLTSKAVKAKEKNKILILEALLEYGEDPATLIKKHGGDLEYFYE